MTNRCCRPSNARKPAPPEASQSGSSEESDFSITQQKVVDDQLPTACKPDSFDPLNMTFLKQANATEQSDLIDAEPKETKVAKVIEEELPAKSSDKVTVQLISDELSTEKKNPEVISEEEQPIAGEKPDEATVQPTCDKLRIENKTQGDPCPESNLDEPLMKKRKQDTAVED